MLGDDGKVSKLVAVALLDFEKKFARDDEEFLLFEFA